MLKIFPFLKRISFHPTALFILSAIVVCSEPAEAALYKWMDDSGAINFTNDLSDIPKKYRDRFQLYDTGSAPFFKPSPSPTSPEFQSGIPSKFIAPINIKGSQYYVQATLNDSYPVSFLIDTGASVVVLSEELAKRMGFRQFDSMPQTQVKTAAGEFWAPLVSLKRFRIAGVVADDVEAIISSNLDEFDGLLGMSFLEQFKMNLDFSKRQLVLKPLQKSGEPLYAGKPGSWWKKKLESYSGSIRHFKLLSKQMWHEADKKAYNVDQTIRHYQDLYKKLDNRAIRVRLPEKYRLDNSWVP